MGHVWEDRSVSKSDQKKTCRDSKHVVCDQKDQDGCEDCGLSHCDDLPVREFQRKQTGEKTSKSHSDKVERDQRRRHICRQSYGFRQIGTSPDQTGRFQSADPCKHAAGRPYFFLFIICDNDNT